MARKNKLNLYSESFGERNNPTILLIMGAMNQSIFWPKEFCETLAQAGFYVIRYDHRDTGQSDGVDFQSSPYDLVTLKKDAIDVLTDHGVLKATIIGLSMGGYIGQLLAIENPEIVSNLILVSTSADQHPYMKATMGKKQINGSLPKPSVKFIEYIENTIASPPLTEADIRQNLIEGWRVTYAGNRAFPKTKVEQTLNLAQKRSRLDVQPMNHALAVNASPDRKESVSHIRASTLIVHGKYDPCLPLEHAQYLADKIPSSTLKVFEMGHSFQWAWDQEIAEEIIRFILKQEPI